MDQTLIKGSIQISRVESYYKVPFSYLSSSVCVLGRHVAELCGLLSLLYCSSSWPGHENPNEHDCVGGVRKIYVA